MGNLSSTNKALCFTFEFFEEIIFFDVEITSSPNPVTDPTNKASPWGLASLPRLKKHINLPFYLATTIFLNLVKQHTSVFVLFFPPPCNGVTLRNQPRIPFEKPRRQRHRSSRGARGGGEGTAIGASKFAWTSSLGFFLRTRGFLEKVKLSFLNIMV